MKPTTSEVIDVLDSQLCIWQNSFTPDPQIIACLKRAIAIVRASARVKASRKGRAKR